MVPTRSHKETIYAELRNDPEFRQATFSEAKEALKEDEITVALSMLRELVHATITLNGLAEKTDIDEDSLRHMLSDCGNPTDQSIDIILKTIREYLDETLTLSQHTIGILRDILGDNRDALDANAEQRLQWICQEKLYALDDLNGEIAQIKTHVRTFEKLTPETRQKVAKRIEAYFTDHLHYEVDMLKKWIEELRGTPIDSKELERRIGFGGHFNPDIRFAGKLEEKYIHSLSGMHKLLFGEGDKPKKAETYVLGILIQELRVFFEEVLSLEPGPALFSEFTENLISDPAMEKLHVGNIQKVIESIKRSGGNLLPE